MTDAAAPAATMPGARRLLHGVRVVDLADEPGARAARILSDLGADVVRIVPETGDPLERRPATALAFNAGKRVTSCTLDAPELDRLLCAADVVFSTPGAEGYLQPDPGRALDTAWIAITPFGLDGPRATWRASDLGVMAASGNMFCTGHPDRAPVRCTEPTGYCHAGAEAAFAALTALAGGVTGVVDLSMSEAVLVANMAGQSSFPTTGYRGSRRGASIGRAREIWRTADGWVSFGLRGGKARVPTLELLTRLCVDEAIPGADALAARDWAAFNPNTVTDDELRAIEAVTAEYFSRHTMADLFHIACENNWMLAPAMSPREICGSRQLAARGFFGPVGDVEAFPRSFVQVSGASSPEPVAPAGPATTHAIEDVSFADGGAGPIATGGPRPWDGLRILEFGSGAAGPIAARFFAEQGATVLRVESVSRPDFLRVYALGPQNPHGLEGSALYDILNVGKRDVTFNLKTDEAVELVRRLVVEWADAVSENFAPRAMRGFGLDYESLVELRADLVMVSACLNGQTGPYRDYPGFGSQGAALSGYNHLTGWPDREPVGPHATITDSLAPRYVASALAAGLLYRRRTGAGVHLDVSQVEAGIWSLAPWIVEWSRDGVLGTRAGNRSAVAVPHGAFPCADEGELGDRWVAIACWSDADWAELCLEAGIDRPELASLAARRAAIDEVEGLVTRWTRDRTRLKIATGLQERGVEAVPVADLGDLHDDPQLQHRRHWLAGEHPVMGPRIYERNGYRLPDDQGDFEQRHSPTLGQDNEWVLTEILGLGEADLDRLSAQGVVEPPPRS